MERELLALINDHRQYSESDFESCPKILDINRNTTIGELIDWHDRMYCKKTHKIIDGEYTKTIKKPEFFNQIHILEKQKK